MNYDRFAEMLRYDLEKLDKLHEYYKRSNPLKIWSDQEKDDLKHSLTYHSNKIEGLQLKGMEI